MSSVTNMPMLRSCDAPKMNLRNGMRLSTTYKPNVQGGSFLDIWVTDKDGTHVASVSIAYRNDEQKKEKLRKAINDLKLEILSYEAGKVAEQSGNDPKAVIDYITKRWDELGIEKKKAA